MFDNGIYQLTFESTAGREPEGLAIDNSAEALAVLRNGTILGSDCWGGVFSGSYEFDGSLSQNKVRLRVELPPESELITGLASGPEGATIDIAAALGPSGSVKSIVEIGGCPVAIGWSFLGPLPD